LDRSPLERRSWWPRRRALLLRLSSNVGSHGAAERKTSAFLALQPSALRTLCGHRFLELVLSVLLPGTRSDSILLSHRGHRLGGASKKGGEALDLSVQP
jgi:hypothetical protein